MPDPFQPRRLALAPAVAIGAASIAAVSIGLLAGCAREEPIRTYRLAEPSDTPSAESGPPAVTATARPPRAPAATAPNPAAGPAGQPSGSTPAIPIGQGELAYDTPEGWTPKPASAMRKASFTTAGGGEVTAFVFPATAPAMADPLANINRWRGEIGLAPTTAEALPEEVEGVTIDGAEGTYATLVGETDATLAAMTRRGDDVWFFKLKGPKEAITAETPTFREWLGTVRFGTP